MEDQMDGHTGDKDCRRQQTMAYKKSPKRHRCPFPDCQYSADKPVILREHMNSHTKDQPYECEVCHKRFGYKTTLIRHKWVVHNIGKRALFACEYPGCGYKTSLKSNLNDHNNSHTGDRPYVCSQCGQTFAVKHYLKGHIKTKHELSAQPLVCNIKGCNKEFTTEKSFKSHQNHHFTKKKFFCDHPGCDYRAINPSTIENHKRSVHSDERHFSCHIDGCHKRYKTAKTLNQHLKSHSTALGLECTHEGCHKTLKNRETLKNHLVVHSAKMLSCEWPGCEFKAARISAINRHMLNHSGTHGQQCVWPGCGQMFMSKQLMERHLAMHSQPQFHACHWPGCQFRSQQLAHITKHMDIHYN